MAPQATPDVFSMTQEGVLEVMADRYAIHPTTWKVRGRVVGAIWKNGVLIGGTIYQMNPANPEEFSIVSRQAVFHFSPDDPEAGPLKSN